jgi:hypothetical protein
MWRRNALRSRTWATAELTNVLRISGDLTAPSSVEVP